VASAQEPRDDTSTPEIELRARLVTYLHLAGAGDPRNAAFLRTALRTERDPALRAVIAEALYRSDPDDSAAERAVMETFAPSQEVFGRLHEASVALGITTPVVNTLLDLAANGSDEAMRNLVQIAASSRGDEKLEQLMATGLLEVSRTAPEELLGALKVADDGQQGAVAALIARGVVPAGEGQQPAKHPFQTVLAGAVEGPDPMLASFARGMESRIEESLLELSGAGRAGVPEGPPPADAPAPGGG
jgi:D-alanyl-D-alanine carboxypeptidase/D-alanyl-D-alanine-endopeptidase (penicillin-binding protein 4)